MKKAIALGLILILVVTIGINLSFIQEAVKVQAYIMKQKTIYARDQYKIPVLMYHHLTYDSSKWNESCISPDKFREELLYLKLLGYNTILFREYISHIESGTTLPENPIIITFDDGYKSNYDYAYPLLKKYDMKASFFIIGWSVGRKFHKDSVTPINEHFDWQQAEEMLSSGLIEIQHHSYDLHNPSNKIDYGLGVEKLEGESVDKYRNRFISDLDKLSVQIENQLNGEVYAFAYPYGIHNEYSEEVLKEKKFVFTLTTEKGISDFSQSTYLIKRLNMTNKVDSRNLIRELAKEQQRDIYLPYEAVADQQNRVKKLEGALKLRLIYQRGKDFFIN